MEIVEYPKWVKGVVVQNRDEEDAVLDGRAVFKVTASAAGETRELASITPRKPGMLERAKKAITKREDA